MALLFIIIFTFDINILLSNVLTPVCAAVLQSESSQLEAVTKAKLCTPHATMCPDSQGTASMETLVGSQKRKARKTKITHLVRTADGRVSPVEGKCCYHWETYGLLCSVKVFTFYICIQEPEFPIET